MVDQYLRTSDPAVYAVGDAVEFGQNQDISTGGSFLESADKQGYVAASNIAGLRQQYKGAQATSLIRVLNLAVGTVGWTEKTAKQVQLSYDKVYVRVLSHAEYYPGSIPIDIKVLFERETGLILGAQLIGVDGVDKWLAIFSMAVQQRMLAKDFAALELGYTPPFSSEPNSAHSVGCIIDDLVKKRIYQYHWEQVPDLLQKNHVFVDVRMPAEYISGHIDGAVNVPLDTLRARLNEFNKDVPLYLYCQDGHRSYLAARILMGHGFSVRYLSGGYRLYAAAALHLFSFFGCSGYQ
ncbi:Coenzyme A disulfide reductase [bioreactor metagenome]|uniref:Coenzyme A disulfide reductase n=1 Tax=bioreactor metagenome TaxID=1076179 RepID=A0A645DDQ1_9ZZZZ